MPVMSLVGLKYLRVLMTDGQAEALKGLRLIKS